VKKFSFWERTNESSQLISMRKSQKSCAKANFIPARCGQRVKRRLDLWWLIFGVNLTGLKCTQISSKVYFWVYLCRCFWSRMALDSVNCPHLVVGHQIWQKGKGNVKSLFSPRFGTFSSSP
jgi:hypothetical protein